MTVNSYKSDQALIRQLVEALNEVKFIASAAGHGPCRCGGMGEDGVCPNSCFCEWATNINNAIGAALAVAKQWEEKQCRK